jgi:uncharacterized membrane protein
VQKDVKVDVLQTAGGTAFNWTHCTAFNCTALVVHFISMNFTVLYAICCTPNFGVPIFIGLRYPSLHFFTFEMHNVLWDGSEVQFPALY